MKIPDSAYPLTWPASWTRHKGSRPSAPFFGRTTPAGSIWARKRDKSMSEATTLLFAELSRMGASRCVVSTNVAVKLDGTPYSNRTAPSDPGAAVYFVLKSKPIVLACDKWNRVEDNVYAIAKHIESIRAQDRWGVGRIEQAFAGYMALPAPMDLKPYWEVLGCREDATENMVRTQYRALAKTNHPDNGGSHEAMTEVNIAWENAKLARGWN